MKAKEFEAFDIAFDYCREVDSPVVVIVQGDKYKLFPSGHAKIWQEGMWKDAS